MKTTDKKKRGLLIEANRRLQETSQELFMAKQDLEKKNKELQIAEEKEKHRNEELERELNAFKQLAGHKKDNKIRPVSGEKLTKGIAEELSLIYIHLLESYIQTKYLDKNESIFKELCRKFDKYDISPKGIINMHIKSVSQIKIVDGQGAKRATFESRMVLLKVMTDYASLLQKKAKNKKGTV